MKSFKKWLKRIILVPFWLFMGNIDGVFSEPAAEVSAEETPASVTAEGETEVAELQGAEGGEPETEEVAEDKGAEPPVEGEEGKHKRPGKPLTERIAEIEKAVEAKFAAKVADLEARLSEVAKTQVASDPDLKPIDYAAVNQFIGEKLEEIESLKLGGRLIEALDIQDGITKLRADIKAHEAKRAEKLTAQIEQEKTTAFYVQLNQKIEHAAEIIRADAKMTPEAFQQARVFFEAERSSKPLVNAQYEEILMSKGAVSAILWAKEYVEKNMGVKEKREQEKREQAKEKLAPSASASAEQTTLKAEVDKLYKQLEKDPHNEDLHLKWREAKSKIT